MIVMSNERICGGIGEEKLVGIGFKCKHFQTRVSVRDVSERVGSCGYSILDSNSVKLRPTEGQRVNVWNKCQLNQARERVIDEFRGKSC